MIRCPSFC